MNETTKKKFAELLYRHGYHDLMEALYFNPERGENFEELLLESLEDFFADIRKRADLLYKEKQLLSKSVEQVVNILEKMTDDIRELYKK